MFCLISANLFLLYLPNLGYKTESMDDEILTLREESWNPEQKKQSFVSLSNQFVVYSYCLRSSLLIFVGKHLATVRQPVEQDVTDI